MRPTTSASNLHRRVRCPGSHHAEHGLPEENSEYAAEGTALHAALAPGPARLMENEQADLVDSTKRIIDEALTRTRAAFAIAADEHFEEGYEEPLTLRKGLRTVITGHCDYWRYWPASKLLFIADAKFGFIEVTPAPLNLQLRAYAAMGSKHWDCENAVVAIAQPRAYMIEGAQKLSIAQYDRAELALAVNQILEWEAGWLAPDAPRAASEEACRYCKAKMLCDTYAARMAPARTATVAGIADLNVESFMELWQAIQIASNEDFQERLKAEARTRVAEGRMPGYRLKPNAPRRSITDPVAAARILRDDLQFDPDSLAKCSKISLGDAQDVLRTMQPITKLKVKEAKEMLDKALAPVIESKTPSPSIVPITEEYTARHV